MKNHIPPLWITGTSTDIGKSHFTAWLLKSWQNRNISAWKPLQSGVNQDGLSDSEWISTHSHHPIHNFASFKNPLSPHICMELEQVIDMDLLNQKLSEAIGQQPTIIEGAGGCLSPWTRTILQADWIQRFHPIAILVCPTEVGAIHSSLTSLEALKSRGIPCIGFVYSRPPCQATADNTRVIEDFGKVPFLGQVPAFPWSKDSQDQGLSQKVWDNWTHFCGGISFA